MPTDVKGKAMKITSKKRKYADADTARAAAVAAIIERAERGGARSGVVIADQLSPTQRATVEAVERLMVVQLGLSCLRDDVPFWRRVSLRGSHSSRLSQQSRQSKL